MRLRNFKHMLRYTEDRQWLLKHENAIFLNAYLSSQSTCNANELQTILGV